MISLTEVPREAKQSTVGVGRRRDNMGISADGDRDSSGGMQGSEYLGMKSPVPHELGTVMCARHPSTMEMEAGESAVEVHREFKASLQATYMSQNKTTKKATAAVCH